MMIRLLVIACAFVLLVSCHTEQLHQISVEEFKDFVNSTGYVTDAERLGSTFIQNSVFDYELARNVSWRKPDGIHEAQNDYPVTQVSYNDAEAYCEWKKCKLPSYEQYWELVSTDTRPINTNGNKLMPIDDVNMIGNVWEFTNSAGSDNVRLAGGSYLCNTTTCNGTDPNRFLTVDRITSNSHIGFCILISN